MLQHLRSALEAACPCTRRGCLPSPLLPQLRALLPSATLADLRSPFSPSRAQGLLEEAERLFTDLEDRHDAAHCCYLRALLADGLGQAALRDAAAASFSALQQPRAGD